MKSKLVRIICIRENIDVTYENNKITAIPEFLVSTLCNSLQLETRMTEEESENERMSAVLNFLIHRFAVLLN